VLQHRKDVCDEVGTFEPAQRPYGDPNGLRISAPKTSSDGRKIGGRLGTPILRDQDGQATCRNSDW
jgi:hypothetical protein